MPANCVFCEILQGARAAHVVFEDAHSVAFLDQRPLFPGHCLLVPRQHHETLPDLPPELVGPLFGNVRLLTRVVERAMQAEGAFVAINNRVSQSVPHLHVHIVPRRRKDGLRGFFWPRGKYESEEEAVATRDVIRAAVTELQGESAP
jgi:histidine triad (HIT) family protein